MKTAPASRSIAFLLLVAGVALPVGPARAQFPHLVKLIYPGGSAFDFPGEFAFEDWNGRAVFMAKTAAEGAEPWISDGTLAGTQMLADILPGTGSSLGSKLNSVEWNGFHYFYANDGAHGEELWRSDGTPAGTTLFLDLAPGATSSSPRISIVAGHLLIVASTPMFGREFWISDGTVPGTQPFLDINPGPSSGVMSSIYPGLGNLGLFLASDGVHGSEPWVTDGTPGGTFMLSDVNPGPASGGFMTRYPAPVLGSVCLFASDDGVHGNELWATDGTAAGTHLVLDINPGLPGSLSTLTALFGSIPLNTGLLFGANTAANGGELWMSDGTSAGTFLLADLQPGPTSSDCHTINIGTATAVFVASTPATGFEPWITDGTPTGTSVVDMLPGPGSGSYSTNSLFCSSGGRAYFPAFTSATSYELGSSDGTLAGTGLIKDLMPGVTSGFGPLVPVDGFLIYNISGQSAYSNGLPGTTQLLESGPNTPWFGTVFTARRIGQTIFLNARDTLVSAGRQLYALDVDGDGDGTVEYFDSLNFRSDCLCPASVSICGNSDPSAGCANSTGLGAIMAGSGTTNLASDDLVLTTTQFPPSINGLMFMGSGFVSAVPFHDGVRCVGGSLARWPVQNAGPGGTMVYGPGLAAQAATLFSPAFRFLPATSWNLQVWYRDNAGPCASGSNVSSSGTVVFTP